MNSVVKSSGPTVLSPVGCVLQPDNDHSILDINCGMREIKRNDERGMDCWIREVGEGASSPFYLPRWQQWQCSPKVCLNSRTMSTTTK